MFVALALVFIVRCLRPPADADVPHGVPAAVGARISAGSRVPPEDYPPPLRGAQGNDRKGHGHWPQSWRRSEEGMRLGDYVVLRHLFAVVS